MSAALSTITTEEATPGQASVTFAAVPDKGKAPEQQSVPQVSVNGSPVAPSRRPSKSSIVAKDGEVLEESIWGSNFWVTLVNPQVCVFRRVYGFCY